MSINSENPTLVKKIVDICNQIWTGFSVERNDIAISRFENGMVSAIYHVQFVNKTASCNSVVVKFFENPPYNVRFSQINSLVIGQCQLAPKVLLIKDDAIVYEFVNARALTYRDDTNENIFRLLAIKLAKFHSLDIPITRNDHHKRITYLLDEWVTPELFQRLYSDEMKELFRSNKCNYLLSHHVQTEASCLVDYLLKTNFPIVFSHCDFNHTNILLKQSSVEPQYDIQLIDFDYSCYHYRGTDFGKYFSECEQNDLDGDKIISDQRMLQFIEYYIEESCRIHGDSFRSNPLNSSVQILNEAKLFILYAYLIDILFYVWMALKQVKLRQHFILSAEKRLKSFLKLKKRLQDENIFRAENK